MSAKSFHQSFSLCSSVFNLQTATPGVRLCLSFKIPNRLIILALCGMRMFLIKLSIWICLYHLLAATLRSDQSSPANSDGIKMFSFLKTIFNGWFHTSLQSSRRSQTIWAVMNQWNKSATHRSSPTIENSVIIHTSRCWWTFGWSLIVHFWSFTVNQCCSIFLNNDADGHLNWGKKKKSIQLIQQKVSIHPNTFILAALVKTCTLKTV